MTQAIPPPKRVERYEMVPPEGGWGYFVTFAVSLMFIVTIVPISSFGIVFGPFLANLGDETGATTLVNGIFNTVLCFSGLPANHLLQKYSYRKVGIIGAIFFIIGAFGCIFVKSVFQLIIAMGIFQGIGFGLMMPAGFSAFHGYFEIRQNVMMGICQAIIVVVMIIWPALSAKWMEIYGFQGTVILFAAVSLNGILAMSLMQPARWHYRKKLVTVTEMETFPGTDANTADELEKKPRNKFLEDQPFLVKKSFSEHNIPMRLKTISVASLNGFASSIQNIHQLPSSHLPANKEKRGLWESISESLDLGLFKDPVYVNIAFGLSLGMTSDLAFISIYPLLLANYGFAESEITLIIVVYFTADLMSRILLCVISAIMPVWNRYVFLIGALFSAIFRIAFTMYYTFWWVLSVSAVLGFLRCFIQTPLPLVVAEQYGPRFTTAFSLYMVVCGFVALTVGILSGIVKDLTKSNIMVVHLLTVVYLLCAIPWLIEVVTVKILKKNK